MICVLRFWTAITSEQLHLVLLVVERPVAFYVAFGVDLSFDLGHAQQVHVWSGLVLPQIGQSRSSIVSAKQNRML